MQSTTLPQPPPIPENHDTRWHRIVGRFGRIRHAETSRQTGNAGTFVGFACGRTLSTADISRASLLDRKCAPCTKAIGAAR